MMKAIKIIIIISVCLQFSCKKYLEIGPPKSALVQQTVFQNNDQATSAVLGLYAFMRTNSSYSSGSDASITAYAGTSSDELIGYSSTNIPFYQNQLTPDFSSLQGIYSGPYQSIYTANSIIEGLSSAGNGVTPEVKKQLLGEAYFVRAFANFYLVNLFGPVPILLSTDYRVSQTATRSSVTDVYSQILSDLKQAENLLPETYSGNGRVRPNKSAAQAMLARTYLYIKDWINAEVYASKVISKTGTYSLVDLNSVFLTTSQEAIWQLMPPVNSNSEDGLLFNLTTTPIYVSLNSDLVLNGFEAGDQRKSSWVKSLTVGNVTYYYPFKYKVRSSASVTEYSMALRLGEQYLIRAEARINQDGKIDQGISDLNTLRIRARQTPSQSIPNPLPALSLNLSKSDALLAVEKERKVELFSEWGHRWLDLKRTGRADAILAPIKSAWKPTDVLYPIPLTEISRNPKITQNDGY